MQSWARICVSDLPRVSKPSVCAHLNGLPIGASAQPEASLLSFSSDNYTSIYPVAPSGQINFEFPYNGGSQKGT